MIVRFLRGFARGVRRAALAPNTERFCWGVAAGLIVPAAIQPFFATVGNSTPSVAGCGMALLAACWAGSRLARTRLAATPFAGHVLVLLAISCLACMSWSIAAATELIGLVRLEWLESSWLAGALLTACGLIVVFPPMTCLLALALRRCVAPQSNNAAEQTHLGSDTNHLSPLRRSSLAESPAALWGAVCGIVSTLLLVGPAWSLPGALLIASIGTALAGTIQAIQWRRTGRLNWTTLLHADMAGDAVDAQTNPEAGRAEGAGGEITPMILATGLLAACAMLAGVAAMGLLRVIEQLFPSAGFTSWMGWAGLLAGFALANSSFVRRLAGSRGPSHLEAGEISASHQTRSASATLLMQLTRSLLVLGAGIAFVLAFYPQLIEVTLLINAKISTVWLLLSLRSLTVLLCLIPAGWACGFIRRAGHDVANTASHQTTSGSSLWQRSRASSLVALPLCSFLGGLLLADGVLLPEFGAAALLGQLALACALSATACLVSLFAMTRSTGKELTSLAAKPSLRNTEPREKIVARLVASNSPRSAIPVWRVWGGRAAFAGSLLLAATGPFVVKNADPLPAARLLFSTNVFIARQAAMEPEMLLQLDDARLTDSAEGSRGHLSVWRMRGSQLLVRENGVPKGMMSTNPRMAPQISSERLQALIPLVLHDRVDNVLILGLGSGVTLTTSMSFPVLSMTCVESDAAMLTLAERCFWKDEFDQPGQDSRVQFVRAEPALALAAAGPSYDLIVSNPDHPLLRQSSATFTTEFYKNAARRLSADGILCQRFQQSDFGAMPLRTVVRSMRTAFQEVVAVETGVGEMALLATNSPKSLIRDGFVRRLQAPHVRKSLAELGWDWSTVLNLPAYSSKGLEKFATEGVAADVNTAANGRLSLALPGEVFRWGNKWQELQQGLTVASTRFLQSDKIDGNSPAILQRLGEVTAQRKLMSSYPDQPWAYRKTVREQVRNSSRSVVKHVSHDETTEDLDADDRLRMRYFSLLGVAAKQKNPTPDDILRIVHCAEPYDPLISYFMHYEVAELYGRSQLAKPRQELEHRLHEIYYAPGDDRSVRNVATTMTLLAEKPEAEADPARRWDHLNGLLQMMKARWNNRGMHEPKSTRIVLNDVEISLAALDKGLEAMDQLAEQAESNASDWNARRKFVEVSLVRPLRTYRTQLVQHHLREKEKARKLLEAKEKSSDESDIK